MRTHATTRLIILGLLLGCRGEPAPETSSAAGRAPEGRLLEVRDTVIDAAFDAAGVAAPIQQATLSTRLMGTITDVLVEGSRVAAGQQLVRIDARDLSAKAARVAASIAEAEAMRHDATAQANRIRALYADSAATRALLDGAEAKARAGAGGGRGPWRSARARRGRGLRGGACAVRRCRHPPLRGSRRLRRAGNAARDGAGRAHAPHLGHHDARPRPGHRSRPDDRDPDRALPAAARVEGVVPPGGALYTINALVNAEAPMPGGGRRCSSRPGPPRGLRAEPSLSAGDLTGVRVQPAPARPPLGAARRGARRRRGVAGSGVGSGWWSQASEGS